MKARLIRIGNSRGVRLPKSMIVEADLGEEIELHVRDNEIVISKAAVPRAGWAQAAKKLASRDEDILLDEPASTHFDREEWKW